MDRNLVWILVLLVVVGLGARFSLEPTVPQEIDTPAPLEQPHPPKSPPESLRALGVVETYLKALQAGDYRQAYVLLAPYANYGDRLKVKAGWSYERFTVASVKRDRKFLNGYSIRRVTRKTSDRMEVQVDFASGRSIYVELIRVDGQWYLLQPPWLGVAGDSP